MKTARFDGWLTAIVVVHLLISFVHGSAHDGGHVMLTPMQSIFVYGVILAGPLAGLLLFAFSARAGALLVTATMAGSLLFGLINHFIIVSPDHVSQVAAEWRTLFTATAALLVASEAAGVLAGVRALRTTSRRREVPS
jgi:hypothetical protein